MVMRLAPSAGFPSSAERIEFQPDDITIELLDGKRVSVMDRGKPSWTLAPPPVGTTVRWLDGVGEPSYRYLTFEPLATVRWAIRSNTRSVSVAGIVTSLQSRPIASLPLRIGESLVQDGRRIVIYGFSHDTATADVWIQLSTIPRDLVLGREDMTTVDDLRFALVNDARSEAFLLRNWSSRSNPGGLVLPWILITTSYRQLQSDPQGSLSHNLPRDDAWYRGARLVVLEWTLAGRFPARGEVALR